MFAKGNGNRAAGRECKADERCIRRWRGQEGVLKNAQKEEIATTWPGKVS